MPRFDYQCGAGHLFESFEAPDRSEIGCKFCKGRASRVWLGKQFATAFDKTETTVVWENAAGEIRYPGRNDEPIPQRYAAQGFQRRELRSLREVERFEREKGVRNERAWFDKGSGRSFDNDGRV